MVICGNGNNNFNVFASSSSSFSLLSCFVGVRTFNNVCFQMPINAGMSFELRGSIARVRRNQIIGFPLPTVTLRLNNSASLNIALASECVISISVEQLRYFYFCFVSQWFGSAPGTRLVWIVNVRPSKFSESILLFIWISFDESAAWGWWRTFR